MAHNRAHRRCQQRHRQSRSRAVPRQAQPRHRGQSEPGARDVQVPAGPPYDRWHQPRRHKDKIDATVQEDPAGKPVLVNIGSSAA
jgi:hypothetical protein